MYGSDRFAPDPAPPPRVGRGDTVQFTACPQHVPLSGEACPDRDADPPVDAVGGGYPQASWTLTGPDALDTQADNTAPRADQTSFGGAPSDMRPGGMLDVFA